MTPAVLVALVLQHRDTPRMELVYFWSAVLIALTPVVIFGTIGVLVLRKIWKERHQAGERETGSGV